MGNSISPTALVLIDERGFGSFVLQMKSACREKGPVTRYLHTGIELTAHMERSTEHGHSGDADVLTFSLAGEKWLSNAGASGTV